MLSNNSLFCSSTRISALLVEVPPQPPLRNHTDSIDVSRPWGQGVGATNRPTEEGPTFNVIRSCFMLLWSIEKSPPQIFHVVGTTVEK